MFLGAKWGVCATPVSRHRRIGGMIRERVPPEGFLVMLPIMQGRQFSNDSEIARAGLKFLDLSLPKAEWTHAAHFAVTLWLMRHRPDLNLKVEMRGLIRAFNEATGTPIFADASFSSACFAEAAAARVCFPPVWTPWLPTVAP